MPLPTPALMFLVLVAFAAGLVDAIAGGGGLLTLPALLATGVPPHLALGTNKGQSVVGSLAALLRFAHAGRVDGRLARRTFPLGLVGSLAGAALVMAVSPTALRPIIVVLLVAAASFVWWRRPVETAQPREEQDQPSWRAAVLAVAVGAYDGFFGPGTGTFLIVGFVALLGQSLSRATANAKVVNFASNLAAVALFASRGVVLWKVALPMAVGQFLGGLVGAHLAIRGGDKLVRQVVLLVVAALVVKLVLM